MRKLLAILTAVTVLAVPGVALATDKLDKPPKSEHKITICHKEKETIEIDWHAWKAHEKHRDTKGECPPVEPPVVPPVVEEPKVETPAPAPSAPVVQEQLTPFEGK